MTALCPFDAPPVLWEAEGELTPGDADLFAAIHAALDIPAFDIAAYLEADTYAKRAAEVAALCVEEVGR